MISIREFSEVAKTIMGLEDGHIQAISIMMSEHFIGEAFDFKFLTEIFIQMGLIKEKIKLDNKSIRVMNRVKEYMTKHQILTLSKLLEGVTFQQTIRVKGKSDTKVPLPS